jgi:Mrp family chromosome partitioning ATPase
MQSAAFENSSINSALVRSIPFREVALSRATCDQQVIFIHGKYGAVAEQYRRMATRLSCNHAQGGTVMITSAAPEDGKTMTAINLAMALAERESVLLVDLDSRRPAVRKRLGLPPVNDSVVEVLLGRSSPQSCILSVEGTRLCVALNNAGDQDVVELMTTERLKRFLDWARSVFTWVILDTPPIFPIADTLEVANYTSIGILVVRARKTPSALLKRAIQALRGRIQYVMFNDYEMPHSSAYRYDNYYYQAPGERKDG